ncbi:MAG: SUMF1/EgtB/PvdO family nonheme iron enzyme [Candidatus Latescibacteria bacterium]|nr:SUMF1/EgtB/PvdO family nonheme iron enzyme [Candidatus Latescibacterota bacterium]NIM22033.1 SUMF1/EgtB/PvdO family nonheme iron enzyme [Candidatus Latescibacterota bacterium]NIM66051.1 SUMF1/EgtB/PvdO family nonheme iron enzyme [Candidatus Latescibacterota bacterium]NIO02459.1 SUMF1/EgtB/PvdO family nonheme iron enzyme [Candidatus Latescibacterota bacterium]NIO29370.1 SUMF1/EgtB/PvdO family nonheme iron enzyme [Candidatus Latescibacterota bacterium]
MMKLLIATVCLILAASGGAAGDITAEVASSPGALRLDAEPESIPVISGMVYIPPGEFLMGSTNEDLRNQAQIDEFPQRRVWIDGFYIDVHEVTNAQYKVFVDSMKVRPPHHWKNERYPVGRDGYPVVGISWHEAAAYARFVGKRLPTEEEWEKAARGMDGRRFPWGDEFDKSKANNGNRPMAIMRFPDGVSPYGLHDMAGNAAEWVDAWYEPYPRSKDDVVDRDFPEYSPSYGDKKYRIYRGGSWNNFAKFLRCANREKAKPDERWGNIGFRCVMDPPWRQK